MSQAQGMRAVVTGASRGVGRGVAEGLGEAGATVYLTGRRWPRRPTGWPASVGRPWPRSATTATTPRPTRYSGASATRADSTCS